ncbi:MAG: hypothetical protein GX140_07855 [Bacteroidales bacterium]|jgi:hypothetical protein|nr:hypothetical protein [Bacteroidales bacterium]
MKNLNKLSSLLLVLIIFVAYSCKEDTIRPEALDLPEGMSMNIYLNDNYYSPLLYDNYVTSFSSGVGGSIQGVKLVVHALLENDETLEISVINYEIYHQNGVHPKPYIFGPNDTTQYCTTIGHPDSLYCDGAEIRYILAEDYIYTSDNNINGSVNITSCNPVKQIISGDFKAMLVAKPPYADTLFIQGDFQNQHYGVKINPDNK